MNRKTSFIGRCLKFSRQVFLAMLLLGSNATLPVRQAAPSPTPLQAQSSLVSVDNPPSTSPVASTVPHTVDSAPLENPARTAAGKTELVGQRTANSATFDLGNGDYMLVQDTQPMHYQDTAGAWQRIDPAFVAAPGGWTNAANTLRTGVSARSARANLALAQTGVGWEPHSLEVVDTAGTATPWATTLAETSALTGALSADERIVTYPASWSDPALQDRWESGYGQAEYSLRIESPPSVPPTGGEVKGEIREAASPPPEGTEASPPLGGIEGGSLALRVTLHLFPGTRLQVNGAPVAAADLPLETSGELAFVSDSGETLWLQPPQAYEEGDPTQRVAGSYRITAGADASSLELAARIPYDWLSAVERQYPVVLDPVFQVLPSADNLVRNATYVNGALSEWGPLNPEALRLGHRWTNSGTIVDRLFARFPLPSLPPGETTITAATLEVLPTGVGWDAERVAKHAKVEVTLYKANADWWTANPPSGAAAPGTQQGLPHTLFYSDGAPSTSERWNVLTLVQAWHAHPSTNNGIVLAVTNESCVPCPLNGHDYCSVNANCTGFDFDASPALNEDATDFAAGSGGLRLIVTYTGPTLDEGETITCTPPLCSNPAAGDNYHNAVHEYRVQGLSSAPYYWQAIVARGLGSASGVFPPTQYENPYRQHMDGVVRLDLRNTQDKELASSEDTSHNGPNYVLLNRRDAPAAAYRAWVLPNTADAPANGYDIRLIRESGSHQIPISTSMTLDGRSFNTNDPLQLYNLEFPANSHNRIDIEIIGHNHRPTGDGGGNASTYQYAKNFTMQLFNRSANPPYRGAGQSDKNLGVKPGGMSAIGYGDAWLSSGLLNNTGSDSMRYAVALAYGGPAVTVYTCVSGGTEFCSTWDDRPLIFEYEIRVTSCAGNTFPTREGVCQEVKCPDNVSFPAGDPDNKHRTVGGLEVWSADGWTFATTNNAIAPMIGHASSGATDYTPTVAVVGGKVSYAGGIATIDNDSMVLLVACGNPPGGAPPNPIAGAFEVYSEGGGGMQSDGGTLLLPAAWAWSNTSFDPWPTNHPALYSPDFRVNPVLGRVETSVELRQNTGGVYLYFDVDYWATAAGWSSFENTAQQTNTATPPPVAGALDLHLGNDFVMDIRQMSHVTENTQSKFAALRARNAAIAQPANMGGASLPVQVLLMWRSGQLAELPGSCDNGANCLDVRAPNDTPSAPNRNWRMPDIHITGNAGLVMVNTPGQLQAWSADHPAVANSPQAFSQNFSFDTFGGEVSVTTGKCGDLDDATIIKGRTTMALPMIGDGTSPDSMVASEFTLCGDPTVALHEVSFEFRSPIGVPIGSTGLFANGLKGTVEIYPDETTITFGMDCYFGDPNTFQGHGDVTISTKGMFQFQGSGKILGTVKANGQLWVAWNPLDTGFEMGLHYALGDIAGIDGTVRAHAWQGQGWQHKYTWLPDNDEEHFAAQIAATFTIYEGALIDMWPLVIPPVDLSRELEIAFGQFCTNSSCTTYEWGIKAALAVCGYHAGIYYGFDHGVSVILGNDNHTLIDQYGGSTYALAASSPLPSGEGSGVRVLAAPQAVNGVVSLPVTVTANTEELLVGLGWQTEDDLTLELYRPGSTVPVQQSALYNVSISDTTRTDNGVTTHSYLMGVQIKQSGLQGIWEARISNVTPEAHYKFAFLANKGAPGTRADRGQFLTPGANDVQSSGIYPVTWEVLPDATINTTINLYYTMVYSRDTSDPALTVYTRTQNVPIVTNWPYQSGAYHWSTAGLLAKCNKLDPDCLFCYSLDDRCYYQIHAVVDDGVNSFPEGSVSDSGNFCEPCSTIPSEYAFDSRRFPGTSTFSAGASSGR
jgi:hypothetical protein